MNVAPVLVLNAQAVAALMSEDFDAEEREYSSLAMRSLKRALASTTRLLSTTNNTPNTTPHDPDEGDAVTLPLQQLQVFPGSLDYVKNTPNGSGYAMVCQPFLATTNCDKTTQEEAVFVSDQDLGLLTAAMLFNLGLCHHLKVLSLNLPPKNSAQNFRRALYFYSHALNILHDYPENGNDENTSKSLLFVAIVNNTCLVMAELYEYAGLARSAQLALDWCRLRHPAPRQEDDEFAFFAWNAQLWLGFHRCSASAA